MNLILTTIFYRFDFKRCHKNTQFATPVTKTNNIMNTIFHHITPVISWSCNIPIAGLKIVPITGLLVIGLVRFLSYGLNLLIESVNSLGNKSCSILEGSSIALQTSSKKFSKIWNPLFPLFSSVGILETKKHTILQTSKIAYAHTVIECILYYLS